LRCLSGLSSKTATVLHPIRNRYNYPTLTASDLVNAWTYAAAHPEEIEAAIQANDSEKEE
jgi:competence transcription factor ComK